jgi:pyrroloquinoline quinone biosynthesis protein A
MIDASIHPPHPHHDKEPAMTWTTPAFTELRFGFEVTMYIQNR